MAQTFWQPKLVYPDKFIPSYISGQFAVENLCV